MTIAALVLASGLSRRFGSEDKLLADLKGQALLAYCLDAAKGAGFDSYFAVCPDPDPKAELARAHGFKVINNPAPEAGQGASLALGAQHILSLGIDTVCVMLGDMPLITDIYLRKLIRKSKTADIVFSQIETRDQPPAIFRGPALLALTKLGGDQGARALDLTSFRVEHVEIPEHLSLDFDEPSDFKVV